MVAYHIWIERRIDAPCDLRVERTCEGDGEREEAKRGFHDEGFLFLNNCSDALRRGLSAERYAEFIGIADDLPPDFAINHDHYLHGARKQA